MFYPRGGGGTLIFSFIRRLGSFLWSLFYCFFSSYLFLKTKIFTGIPDIGPDNCNIANIFYPSLLCAQKNCFTEAFFLSTQNICFD